tara:strand:+ start:694 stop:933 length:240 start_codon:yes stop_codon:yes gene_type:complete
MMRRTKLVECDKCKKLFDTSKHTFCPSCEEQMKKVRPMTKEERQRAKEREAHNTVGFNLCVSCGCPTPNTWCEFCLMEE